MANYFNTLNLRQQLAQLGKCRFMGRDEFADGASYLQGKKVVPGVKRPKTVLKLVLTKN